MPVNGASIPVGATFTPAGGTAKSYTSDGQSVVNGIHLIDASVTDFRTRPQMTLKTKLPSLDNFGVYSKGRRSLVCTIPKVLASGKTVFPLIRIELEDHPETTAAELAALLSIGANVLLDTDLLHSGVPVLWLDTLAEFLRYCICFTFQHNIGENHVAPKTSSYKLDLRN